MKQRPFNLKPSTVSLNRYAPPCLNDLLSLYKLQYQRIRYFIPNFEDAFLWKVSLTQNPGFRNNPENFHPCMYENYLLIMNNPRSSLKGMVWAKSNGIIKKVGYIYLSHFQRGTIFRIRKIKKYFFSYSPFPN